MTYTVNRADGATARQRLATRVMDFTFQAPGGTGIVSARRAPFDTRDHEAEQTARSPITLTDDKPASEPVNGATLLDETAALIRRHVVMTEAQAHACALWTGAAHAVDGLQRMPMLLVSSNAPECGKTTAATLLSGLVPRPVMVSNLTPAVLFRCSIGTRRR
jgi:hypothetical protein